MTNAIKLMRKTADECDRQARQATNMEIKAELSDMTAKWHWLAKEAAELYDRIKQLDTAVAA